MIRIVWFLSMAAVLYLSLTPTIAPPKPFQSVDKVYHTLAYLWLALLPSYSFSGRRNRIAGALAMLLLGGIIELIQGQVPGRYCSFSDMLANGTGVLLGMTIGSVVNRKVRPFTQ